MLSAESRLRKTSEIAATLKQGRRLASQLLVLHIAPGSTPQTRFAFAVGKSVGNSVVRHRLTRRLRHICAQNIGLFPVGCDVVVRALPGSSFASFSELEKSFLSAAAKAGNQ
jgi:ribonuclease P protein component